MKRSRRTSWRAMPRAVLQWTESELKLGYLLYMVKGTKVGATYLQHKRDKCKSRNVLLLWKTITPPICQESHSHQIKLCLPYPPLRNIATSKTKYSKKKNNPE